MDWYWWILIAVGVIALGYIKVKVGSKYMAKKKQQQADRQKMKDRED